MLDFGPYTSIITIGILLVAAIVLFKVMKKLVFFVVGLALVFFLLQLGTTANIKLDGDGMLTLKFKDQVVVAPIETVVVEKTLTEGGVTYVFTTKGTGVKLIERKISDKLMILVMDYVLKACKLNVVDNTIDTPQALNPVFEGV